MPDVFLKVRLIQKPLSGHTHTHTETIALPGPLRWVDNEPL